MKARNLLFLVTITLLTGCASAPRSADGPRGVLLSSPEGERFLGKQFATLQMGPYGLISSPVDNSITLHGTENKPFKLIGEVWLEGPPKDLAYPENMPDGFALFIRSIDGKHRYSLTSREIDVKRRRNAGVRETKIVRVARFAAPERERWIPFSLETTARRIRFQIGDETGEVRGPVDLDGNNFIALSVGTKLRNVRLELQEEGGRADY